MRAKPTAIAGGGHRYPPPLIIPAVEADAGAMSTVAFEAEASTPMNSYFYPSPSDQARAKKHLERVFVATMSDPAFAVMKAVDPATGEVAAFAIWEHAMAGSASGLRERKWIGGMTMLQTMPWPSQSPSYGNGLVAVRDEGNTNIRDFLAAEVVKFRDSWATKDMNYTELLALATSPRFQRRGYATALLKWGHERADKERQVCFLLGSPVGRYVYAGLGWMEVGQLVVDMKEWIEGADRGDLGWGTWKLYHMIRLPRAVA